MDQALTRGARFPSQVQAAMTLLIILPETKIKASSSSAKVMHNGIGRIRREWEPTCAFGQAARDVLYVLVPISKNMADFVPEHSNGVKFQIGLKVSRENTKGPVSGTWEKTLSNRTTLNVFIANHERTRCRSFRKRYSTLLARSDPIVGGLTEIAPYKLKCVGVREAALIERVTEVTLCWSYKVIETTAN
jgi:hypothetical protein